MQLIKTKIIGLSLAVILVMPFGLCKAESQTIFVINEFQVGGVTAFDEFIELAFIGEGGLDIAGWKLIYTSAGSNPKHCLLAEFDGLHSSQEILVVASDKYVPPNGVSVYSAYKNTPCMASSTSILSPTSGILTIQDVNGIVVDQVVYGSAATLDDSAPTLAPKAGKSMQRKLEQNTGWPVDSNKSVEDFEQLDLPTPGVLPILPSPDPEPNPDDEMPPGDSTDPGQGGNTGEEQPPTDNPGNQPTEEASKTYSKVELSELFIDPASPLLDSNDEWVEIYNPNSLWVDLKGYQIFSGTEFSYHYVFPEGTTIGPNQYIVITSGETSIALANSGGAAKLVDPIGNTLDQTTYEAAKTGQSWAKNSSGTWQWTTQPTQASVNQIVDPVKVITAATKKASSTKPKTASSSKAKSSTAKTTKVKAVAINADEPALIAAPSPLPTWILAFLGLLAILYACYEYRFEIENYVFRIKQYVKNR